ncbi:MAG: sensor domain-containing protein [Acidimicrobiales bacterium]
MSITGPGEWGPGPTPPFTDAARVLAALPDLIVTVDRTGTITWVAPNLPTSMGWQVGDLIGRPMFDMFAKAANHEMHLEAFASILGGPGTYGPLAVTLVTPDGRLREVELMATNALDDPAVASIVAVGRDITERPAQSEQIRQQGDWAATLVLGSSDLIFVCDRFGTIAYASPSLMRSLGLDPHALLGTTIAALIDPDDLLADADGGHHIDRLLGTGPGRRRVVRLRCADGSWRRMRIERTAAEELGDHTFLVTARELTSELDAADLLSEQTVLLEQIARGEPVEDSLRSIAYLASRRLNDGDLVVGFFDRDDSFVCEAPGVDKNLLAVLDRTGISRPHSQALTPAGTGAAFEHNQGWDSVVKAASDGRYVAAWVSELVGAEASAGRVVLLRHHDGDLTHDERDLLGLAADLATIAVERHELQSRLAHAALHDELTGLPNRRFLLTKLWETFQADSASAGVLFVDVDRFKLINDSLGHEVGDQLLQEVARRFRQAVRPADVVARVGGDEFVVLCPDLSDVDAAATLAGRISESLTPPVDLPGGRVVVSASIGVVYATGRVDPTSVLQDADLAMYAAKQEGRNRTALFHEGLRDRAIARLEVENALRDALHSDEMTLHYQPVVRLADAYIVGVEALLRWQRPGIGMVQPADFVPVATDTGLILPLGRWVIDQAVAAAARWPEIEVAANLSARQLADAGLVDFVAATLAEHAVAPSRLCLEVTEADLVIDPDSVVEQLRRFKALGVRLAIDDFGTGFATLDYLRRFSAADVLKVDQSFVAGVTDPTSNDLAIVSAALVLADNLGFDAIAEGVETRAQRDVLEGLGCVLAQGHYFSRAVPAEEIDALLAAGRTLTPAVD